MSKGSGGIGRRSAWAVLCALALSVPCYAVELWSAEDGEPVVTLDTALKFSTLGSYAPDDPVLYPERATAVGLTRLRLTLDTRYNARTKSQVAYEQRSRWVSTGGAGGAGSAILPSFAKAPYRLTQLDWQIAKDGDRFLYRHEIDRAFVTYHGDWGDVTAGRQAIGLGRGVLFSAVDVFSPFTPTEVDREWRRGVDAVRAEYRLTDTSSAEVLGVFGESWDDSAVLGRIRGYLGEFDGEFIVGKRARDAMVAGVMSGVVGEAEVHAELAFYDVPEDGLYASTFGNDHLVTKAVLGSSYTFDVGNGLTLIGEYHYNGFGVEDSDNAAKLLANPNFQKRLLRGDMQSFGRHEAAAQLSYPVNETWTGGLLLLQNVVDGSGLVSPSARWDFSQSGSLTMNAFVPWGQKPDGARIRSEYGTSPASLFVQVSLYF